MGCSVDTLQCGGPPADPGDFTGQTIPLHSNTIMKFLQREGLLYPNGPVKSFSINEYMGRPTWTRPGPTLAFLANIERASAPTVPSDSIVVEGQTIPLHSNTIKKFLQREDLIVEGVQTNQWSMVVGGMFSTGYGGQGTTQHPTPNSAWWLQKAYGDLTGDLLRVSADPNILADAVASIADTSPDNAEPEARIVVGSFSAFTMGGTPRPPQDVRRRKLTLQLSHMPSALTGLDISRRKNLSSGVGRVSVEFNCIAWSNTSAAPVKTSTSITVPAGAQHVLLPLPEIGPNDAMEVILRPIIDRL